MNGEIDPSHQFLLSCLNSFTTLTRKVQIVLDESNNAARRARANAEAMIKFKQRKLNIQNALYIRLIRENDVDEGKSQCGPGREVLECSAAPAAAGVDVPLPPKFERKIVTIHEEDSDIEEDLPSVDRIEVQDVAPMIAAMPHGDNTEEHALEDDNKRNTSPPSVSVLLPSTPSRVVSSSSQTVTTDVAPLANSTSLSSRSSPLRSSSRRMMYADALSCGSIHSRINSCSNHYAKCGNSVSSSCQVGAGNGPRPGYTGMSDTTDSRSISYSEMFSRYDEECNICLTQFQVGDSAAWSMQYGKILLPLAGCNSTSCNGAATDDNNPSHSWIRNGASSSLTDECDVCKHVFHEECISRWLLVRDGCPICRRSYFPTAAMSATTAAVESTPEGEIDLEQGVNNE